MCIRLCRLTRTTSDCIARNVVRYTGPAYRVAARLTTLPSSLSQATALQRHRRSFASTPGTTFASSPVAGAPSHGAASTSTTTRLVCPECGKRFVREGILREHRRMRHLVTLPTPEEAAYAAVEEDIKQLKAQLKATRERIQVLKNNRLGSKGCNDNDKTATNHINKRGGSCGNASDDDTPFPAATVHGRILTSVSEKVLRDWATRHPNKGIGTSISAWVGIGTIVKGTVRFGTLEGFESPSPSPPPSFPAKTAAATEPSPQATPRVLQFQLETQGYRERRPGQLKMFRNRVTVWKLFPLHSKSNATHLPMALFTVREGDLLQVIGNYAQHRTYDAVSKSYVENVVVEADVIGLLGRGPEVTGPSITNEEVHAESLMVGTDEDVKRVASVTAAVPRPEALQAADAAHPQTAAASRPKVLSVTKVKKRKMKRRLTGK